MKTTIKGMLLAAAISMPQISAAADIPEYSEEGKVWVDVTEKYVINYDCRSTEGWTVERSDGGNFRCLYGCVESWDNTFNVWQELKGLPDGYYRLSCQAFDNGDDKNGHAYLYAGDSEAAIRHRDSEEIEDYPENGNCTFVSWGYKPDGSFYIYWAPTDFEAAASYMSMGYYKGNEVQTYCQGGTMKIGIRAEKYLKERWVVWDNFHLEALQDLVPTTSITLPCTELEIIPGETRKLVPSIEPEDASYKTVLWSSSDPKVARVDAEGNVTGYNEGTAVITATARDNKDMKTTITITVKDRETQPGSLLVNEVMSMNIDQILDPSFNYGGWIELYNPNEHAVSLRDCYITEHRDNLTEHRLIKAGVVNAKGFYTIWFDHFDPYYPTQADFKLSTTGDWVAVVSKNGEIVAEIDYPAGVQRCSWARKTDGGDEWGYTAEPTPGATNATSSWAEKQLAAPTVDVPGHIYTGEVTVKVSWPEGSTLRFTVDGSTPTATNGYESEDGIFTFSDYSYNLRLCAIQEGMLPSPVVTNTYIFREHDFTLPVLSVTANEDDLYGQDRGIFVMGSGNGRPGNGQQTPCNWNQDWDRPCTFELFTPEGERSFMQDVDITAAGGWSRAWYPHSFKLKAAKKYGLNSMDYPFFDAKPYNKHKALQIRNGGNDNSCRFKDPAIQTIIQRSGMYVEGQAYQPVIHYINGWLEGVINMREPNNKHHAYSNHGYDTDFLDQFEISPDSGYVQKAGTKDAFLEMLALSEKAADPDTYEKICDEYLDIDEYINYMACWIWLGNNDWMRNNVKAYRSTETDGRFRYVMFDTDGSFAYSGSSGLSQIESWARSGAQGDYLYEFGYRLKLPFENAQLWVNLLQNDQFRKQFVDAFCLVCGSVFEPKRCITILNELYNRVQPMMKLTKESAQSTYSNLKNTMGTSSRNSAMISGIKGYSKFKSETREAISKITLSSNIPEATMLFNGMDVPTGKFTGSCFLPVTITACAPGGYDFVGWARSTNLEEPISTEPELEITTELRNANLVAVYAKHEFTSADLPMAPVRINEVSASNETFANDYFKRNDWIELYNATDEDIDVAGMYLTDNVGKPHKYQIPTQLESGISTVIPAHGYMMVWCDKQESKTQLHASFKLDGDAAACVMLTAADDSWSDYLNYPAHDRNHTAGRYPDGSDNVYLMTSMTPSAMNQMSTYATAYELELNPNYVGILSPVAQSGLVLAYNGTSLTANAESTIEVYTTDGELLLAQPHTTVASTHTLRPGIYVARAKSNGQTATLKFKK